jgi:hypothetical protein
MMRSFTITALLLLCVATITSGQSYGGSYGGGYGSSYSGVYGSNYYADSQQSYYDGYSQAWRYLGWYVDCNGESSRYYEKSQHSGSGDSNRIGNNHCQRYLMWAAVSTWCCTLFVLHRTVLNM